jgi:O-antigen ligase
MEIQLATSPVSTALPDASGPVAFAGRVLLLAVVPLSVLWIPVGRVAGLGNVTASDAALVALWGLVAVALVLGGGGRLPVGPPLLVVLAVAMAVLAGLGSELSAEGRGVVEFLLLMKRFGLAAILPMAAVLFRSRRMGGWTRVLAAAAVALLTACTLRPELVERLPRPEEWDPTIFAGRATGSVTNPNDLSYAAVALAVLHSALLPSRPRLLDRLLLACVLVGATFCVVSSGSRSGVVGAVGAIVFVVVASGIRLKAKLAVGAAAVIAMWVGLTQSAVFVDRLSRAYREGLGEENVYSRLDAQWLAFQTSLSNPFGVGYTGFARATAAQRTYFVLGTSDSVYFDTLLGAGFVGLLCLLGLLLTAWRQIQGAADGPGARARVLQAGLVAFLLFGTATVVPISVFLSPLFFLLVGAAAYLGRGEEAAA